MFSNGSKVNLVKANDLLLRAREMARDKQYKEAAKAFASYLEEQEEQEPQVMLELGFALLLAGDQQGAVIVYETLCVVFQNMSIIPQGVEELWQKFDNLVAGARRKLVLTGVTAAVLVSAGAASAEPNKAYSAHRYSGGVNRPSISLDDFDFDRPRPSGPKKPGFSAHRYSGGVLQPTQLQMFDEIVSQGSAASTTSTTASKKTTATKQNKPGKPGKPKPTKVPIVVPIPKPPVKPGFSAHRYSGGVFMRRREEFPFDEEAVSRRKRIELELRKRRLKREEKK